MRHYVDLMKIQRPERSGYIAVLIGYLVLCAYSESFMLHDYANRLSEISVTCLLFPFAPSCIKEPEPEKTVKAIEKHYRIVMLSPLAKGKKCCTCHVDLHYFGRPILHLHWSYEQTCDSDYVEPREWRTIHPYCFNFGGDKENTQTSCSTMMLMQDGLSYEIKDGEAEYRFHCE